MSAKETQKWLEEENKKGSRSKHDYLKVEPDTTIYIRIGPPWVEEGQFWKERLLHGRYPETAYCGQNDTDEKTKKPRKCLVCRAYRDLKGDNSPKAKALSKLIYQRSDFMWNILLAKGSEEGSKLKIKKQDKAYQLWTLSKKWAHGLIDIFSEDEYREASILGVTDPKTGRWIRVRRIGKQLDTEYKFKALAVQSLGDRDERKEIAKTIIDLDKLITGSTDEELESFLSRMKKQARKDVENGSEKSESESDSEKEHMADKKKKKASESESEKETKKKKKASESESESESEKGSESESESEKASESESEKPKKKKSSKKASESESEPEKVFREMKESAKGKKKKAKASESESESESAKASESESESD